MGTNSRLTRLERAITQRWQPQTPRRIVVLSPSEFEHFTHTGALPADRDQAPDPPVVLVDTATRHPLAFLNMSVNEI